MLQGSDMAKNPTHPVQDKAEVSIDFPDKFFMGSFSRESKFEARAENDGLMIRLIRTSGEKRDVEIHLHHHLMADILTSWAESLANEPPMEPNHRDTMLEALKVLEKAVRRKK
jgi:hypothetical protein